MALIIVGIGLALLVLFMPKKAEGGTYYDFGEEPVINPGTTLDTLISQAASRWGLEEALVRAHIKVESDFNPRAKNPSDPSYGLMAITPILAQTYGYIQDKNNVTASDIETIFNVENNLNIGCRFLAYLYKKYDFDTACQMYNVGETGFKNGSRNSTYLSRVKRWYDAYRTA